MKKSEIIADLNKIHKRLEAMLDARCITQVKEEIETILNQVDQTNKKLTSGCISYSLTGRTRTETEKCRFCGK
ncbi:hypothetical protein VXS04_18370 [Photobacterium piscicola]|uniref:hypothetical protein n=1 Tax=Photobacterium piscicola TaxID=1378299 RepID=UPI002E187CA2|nr:hypothetical protein [Photobacterium piscicola]